MGVTYSLMTQNAMTDLRGFFLAALSIRYGHKFLQGSDAGGANGVRAQELGSGGAVLSPHALP